MNSEYSHRRFRRYDVSRFEAIQSETSERGSQKKLMNLSLGGCCFYELESAKPLSPRERISFSLKFGGETYEVEGSVVYVVAMQAEKQKVIQYGLEFDPGVRDDLHPLLDQLDYLSQTGEVRLL